MGQLLTQVSIFPQNQMKSDILHVGFAPPAQWEESLIPNICACYCYFFQQADSSSFGRKELILVNLDLSPFHNFSWVCRITIPDR